MKKTLIILWTLLLVISLKAQDISGEDFTSLSFEEEEQFEGEMSEEILSEEMILELEREDYAEQVALQTEKIPLPQSVITEMSSREMRYHHYLWHQVREGWNRFTPQVRQQYTDIGWAPPNPARNYDSEGRSSAVLDNLSGQDFLYMHRQMIRRVNEIITLNNEPYGNVTGWKKIPAPGDEDWPVPPLYNVTGNEASTEYSNVRKTDEFYKSIQEAEKTFTDPEQLRSMSLAEMGARIEVTIHSWLHLRFSANCSYGYRLGYINKTNMPYIDPKWDDAQYDWMGDSYSSHVNAAFYKVHGWIDDRIEDWRIANGLSEIIWNSTWEGGPVSNISSLLQTKKMFTTVGSAEDSTMNMDDSGNMNVLQNALEIFLKSGAPETSFTDTVLVNGKLPWEPQLQEKEVSKPKLVRKTRRLCRSRSLQDSSD